MRETSVGLGSHNIIIGKNDVGKSSLLEAIDTFLSLNQPNHSDFRHFDESHTMFLHGEFTDVSDEILDSIGDTYREGTRFDLTLKFEQSGGRTPDEIVLNGEELVGGEIVLDGEELGLRASRSQLESWLPGTVPIISERDYQDQTTLKSDTWLDKLLTPVFDSTNLTDEEDRIKDQFDEQCREINSNLNQTMSSQHPTINNVRIRTENIDLQKSITPIVEVRDSNLESWMPLTGRGSGVGNQFILSMMKAHAESEHDNSYTVLFEEPENSLHPSAIREMGGALEEIALQGNQVFTTTHSPSLINSQESATLIVATNEDGEAEFEKVTDEGVSAIEEIGAKNSDILQSDYVLYTEGPSDAAVFETICSQIYDSWDLMNVSIQPAGGNNLRHQLDNIQEINRNSGLILDSDKHSEEDSLGDLAQSLKDEAEDINLDCWILNRRKLENYFHPGAVEQVLEEVSSISITEFNNAEDNLNQYGYDNDKIMNAKKIAETMYDIGEADAFEEIEGYINGAFSEV